MIFIFKALKSEIKYVFYTGLIIKLHIERERSQNIYFLFSIQTNKSISNLESYLVAYFICFQLWISVWLIQSVMYSVWKIIGLTLFSLNLASIYKIEQKEKEKKRKKISYLYLRHETTDGKRIMQGRILGI